MLTRLESILVNYIPTLIKTTSYRYFFKNFTIRQIFKKSVKIHCKAYVDTFGVNTGQLHTEIYSDDVMHVSTLKNFTFVLKKVKVQIKSRN